MAAAPLGAAASARTRLDGLWILKPSPPPCSPSSSRSPRRDARVRPTGLTAADLLLDRPKNRDHGDWASNAALKLAKAVGANPRELAAEIAAGLETVPGIASVEVAGPGFINIRLDAAAAGALAKTIVDAGASFGTNDSRADEIINLEFVSANPTGPHPPRWHAVGCRRRLARPHPPVAGCLGHAGVLLQRPRRADRPLRAQPGRGAPGRAVPRGRLRRRLHRRHRPSGGAGLQR